MSSQIIADRNERLNELSQIVMGGVITYKLDYIATIFINGRHYFNVFRRYNSDYNIVIEDKNTDIYLHQDYTVRKSLQTIMCISEYDAANIYTRGATSYKHNGPVPSILVDIADMYWTEIQSNYQAVSVNFGGTFELNTAAVTTPIAQIYSDPVDPPAMPVHSHMAQSTNNKKAKVQNTLLSLSIPPQPKFYIMSESDEPTLSMRFADIKKRNKQKTHHISCYCHMNQDDGDENVDENVEDDENNYTFLRSGTQIPKSILGK